MEIARLGNISRATGKLLVSQPTLTRRLDALEDELGVELFVRTRAGVRLTEAGRAFLPHAKRVVGAAVDGTREMDDLRRRVTGTLIVGTTHGFSATVLPRALQLLRQKQPTIRLVVKTQPPTGIVDLVLRGEVALGIMQHIEHPELRTIDLYDVPLVIATSPSHPFAKAGHVRLAQLAAESVIFEAATGDHGQHGGHLRAAGVEPRETMHIDTVEGAKRMVEEGLGVALLPRASLAGEIRAGTLAAVAIDDAVLPPQRVAAIRRIDDGRMPETLRTLIGLLRELGGALGGQRAVVKRRRR
ncbi:MAG TPA: LysR family transcriptional regulator [Candidatus Limnocylindria bacterium]